MSQCHQPAGGGEKVLFKKQSAAYLQRKMQPGPRQSGELRTQRDPPLRTTSFAN